jgi:dTDP-4-dehydrorhamnose reductase
VSKYLITGASGMLGTDLSRALAGRDVSALSRADLDVTSLSAVRAAGAGHSVIINTAAYTKVDDAEAHEDEAHAINAVGAENLAIVAAENGATLVQLSTDYVFDGHATTPYPEDAPLAPVSAYGRTKADGEHLALAANPTSTIIVRTAWLYGQYGPNFARTMLALAAQRPEVSVVTDQVGQPTWTLDLAKQLVALLDTGTTTGIFHATSAGQCSWFDFAKAIFDLGGLDPDRVKPTDSSQFVRPAPRPPYSVLGHDAWSTVGLAPMRDWRVALHDAFATGAFAANAPQGAQ